MFFTVIHRSALSSAYRLQSIMVQWKVVSHSQTYRHSAVSGRLHFALYAGTVADSMYELHEGIFWSLRTVHIRDLSRVKTKTHQYIQETSVCCCVVWSLCSVFNWLNKILSGIQIHATSDTFIRNNFLFGAVSNGHVANIVVVYRSVTCPRINGVLCNRVVNILFQHHSLCHSIVLFLQII